MYKLKNRRKVGVWLKANLMYCKKFHIYEREREF